jgi:ribosomal protein L11 methyltransferase
VRLDPGLAFGTGSHASTRLVLQSLEKAIKPGARVLDYGCGSGILAIVAAKLGAGEVAAVDIDPQALETTAENARSNGVRLQIALPEQLPAGSFDMILANILAAPLIALEPHLARCTSRGGRILLSGILDSQAREVIRAYAANFEIGPTAAEEGWSLLEGTRR